MSEEQKKPATNALGLAKSEYKGGPSTMCKGCGHDRISEAVIQASYDLDIDARNILKMSGIGCSSKTPAYFLGNAMGLNSTHGRMPSFSTGAHVANTTMSPIGVSGDGDSASIGMGQFVHIIRRNPRMVYIIENNGVYGLTKGQFSATADRRSPSKRGAFPREASIDLCGLALELGATFIARSFSGDKKQLVPLLKAALSFDGLAFLDVISPCVTFNNHEGSTKSYTHQKEMGVTFHDPHYVSPQEQIDIEYAEGELQEVTLHDGSKLLLRKLEHEFDPTDRNASFAALQQTRNKGEVLTGLIHIDMEAESLAANAKMTREPLATLMQGDLRPAVGVLDRINGGFKI
ncbi:MAG TPA: 2-oxoacid:ferredoxin oxidoreductase subunit beta [Planctomycetes bacterium]|nr:2-oxoacid:ferredoxin oxidoreductase subunit beta [Planctomycetota bacterium]